MSEKKKIDRVFQEKFRDFEFAPPEPAWDNIRAALEKKKKRRVIPLWFRMSGVAALLVLGFGLFATFNDGVTIGGDSVVTNENSNGTNGQEKIPSPTGKRIHANETVADGDDSQGNPIAQPGSAVASGDGPGNTGTENGKSADAIKKDTPLRSRSTNTGIGTGAPQSVASQNRNSGRSQSADSRPNRNRRILPSAGQSYAATNKYSRGTSGRDTAKGNNVNPVNSVRGEGMQVASVRGATTTSGTGNSATGTTGTAIDKSLPVAPANREAVADTPIDTTSAPKPQNELEKLLQEKLKGEDKDKKELADATPQDRWALKPQVAPVYYSSLSNGSPIDAQFASNSKTYDNNMSYGLGVNYAVNNRLHIRSGVNTVDLSYSTHGIEFYASLNDQTNNVSTAKNANVVVQNTRPPSAVTITADQLPQQKFNGSMVQKMGYIEVPLELSYALVNKKFGIDVIGGVSTLFLNNNNIYVTSTQGYNVEVGEAENLNDVHFSTNFGVGFKYRFWKSFQANFEPTFKYQLNTFSGDAGNFKPYFIGLYSGISFSF